MTHEVFDELAHAALDGTATPEQRAALDSHLARDPGARDRWRDVEMAGRALSKVKTVEPPLDLKPAIMRVVHRESRAAQPANSGSAREPWGRGLALRLASAFAVGAVAGILVWPLLPPGPRDVSRLPSSGAMMPEPGGSTIDRLSLAAGTATLTIEMVAIPKGVAARIETSAGGDAEIVIGHDAALTAESLREIEARPMRVAFAPGSVDLDFSGEMRCTVVFTGGDAATRPLSVTLRAGGMTSTGELGRRSR